MFESQEVLHGDHYNDSQENDMIRYSDKNTNSEKQKKKTPRYKTGWFHIYLTIWKKIYQNTSQADLCVLGIWFI